MRKYYSGEILFCGVSRRYVSQNIVAISRNYWQSTDPFCCLYVIDRFSKLHYKDETSRCTL